MRYLLFLPLMVLASAFACVAHSDDLVWADEFDGVDLNPEKWRQHNPGDRFSGFNDSSATSIENEKLTITTEFRDNKIYTGMISTRGLEKFKNGYMEMKVRFPEMREGLKCSAILQSPLFGDKNTDPQLLPENTGSIVTLFQLTSTQPDRVNSSVTWGGHGAMAQRAGGYSTALVSDGEFHVFGIHMLDDAYEFYLDGDKYLEIDEGISGVEMYLVLSCEIKEALGVFDKQQGASQLDIDYVRYMKSRPLIPKLVGGQPIGHDQWDVTKNSSITHGNHDMDVGFVRSQPDDDESLKVTLVKGSHLGADASFELRGTVMEAWVAYCIRFSKNWVTKTGGKLPGFAGNSAGWFSGGGQGGSPSDGTNSWSARMIYGEYNEESQSIPVGSYVYHTDQGAVSQYGQVNWWAPAPQRLVRDSAALGHEEWYSVKQHLKMNSKNKKDGVIEGWINGELVYQREDYNFTNSDRHRKIHRVWLDVYHGGSETSPVDQYVYFDQFNYSVGVDKTSTHCQ